MRRDVRTARDDMTVAVFRRDFPLGSTQRAVVTDLEGRYEGIVLVPDAHAPGLDAEASSIPITALMRYSDEILLPQMNAKEAVALFNATESEALAVVDGRESRQVLGLLTEAHTLRRYAEELDRRRREISGEV
jgi:CIC family chloride channel protein